MISTETPDPIQNQEARAPRPASSHSPTEPAETLDQANRDVQLSSEPRTLRTFTVDLDDGWMMP